MRDRDKINHVAGEVISAIGSLLIIFGTVYWGLLTITGGA